MTNKNRNRRRQAVKTVTQPKQKPKVKPTPFADAGAIVGSRLGSMFGVPYAKGVGKWLGSGIGQIFGSGDYQIVGNVPQYNILMNDQIPKFSTTSASNLISHREYLGDIFGTAGFNNTLYPLNPGMSNTFPWLSTIAQNFQQYKFHGVMFEFRPLITDFVTNGAPGVVIMATNYNSDLAAYTSKQEMENSEYAVSVKPTRELLHGIECAMTQTSVSQLYVRTGAPATGQDLRLYDLGAFQFASQSNPVQNLGELWVTYSVELFKPVLPADVGGNVLSSFMLRDLGTGASPLGTIQRSITGDLSISATPTVLTWFAQPGNAYIVSIIWVGAASGVTVPGATLTGLRFSSNLQGNSSNPIGIPNAAVVSTNAAFEAVVVCNALVPTNVTMTFAATGSFPVNNTISITVSTFSSEATL